MVPIFSKSRKRKTSAQNVHWILAITCEGPFQKDFAHHAGAEPTLYHTTFLAQRRGNAFHASRAGIADGTSISLSATMNHVQGCFSAQVIQGTRVVSIIGNRASMPMPMLFLVLNLG